MIVTASCVFSLASHPTAISVHMIVMYIIIVMYIATNPENERAWRLFQGHNYLCISCFDKHFSIEILRVSNIARWSPKWGCQDWFYYLVPLSLLRNSPKSQRKVMFLCFSTANRQTVLLFFFLAGICRR